MDSRLEPLPPIESLSDDVYVLHADLQRLAAGLASRDLALGTLAERFWKADGWRKLGFTSERQYARDRVGCSLSSLQQRMRLARNIGRMPSVEEALRDGKIGLEAAMLIIRIGRPEFAEAWVARAQERTVLDLREEVDITETHARLEGCASYLAPPCHHTVCRLPERAGLGLERRRFSARRF